MCVYVCVCVYACMCVCVCRHASRSRATLSCDSSYYGRRVLVVNCLYFEIKLVCLAVFMGDLVHDLDTTHGLCYC